MMASLASLLRLPGNFKDTQWQVLAGPILILIILSMMAVATAGVYPQSAVHLQYRVVDYGAAGGCLPSAR